MITGLFLRYLRLEIVKLTLSILIHWDEGLKNMSTLYEQSKINATVQKNSFPKQDIFIHFFKISLTFIDLSTFIVCSIDYIQSQYSKAAFWGSLMPLCSQRAKRKCTTFYKGVLFSFHRLCKICVFECLSGRNLYF